MDLCFQVVLRIGNTDRRGKIVGITDADDVATFSGQTYAFNDVVSSPRCGFVFAVNAPSNLSRSKLLEPLFPFKFDVSSLKSRQQSLIHAERQLTLPWHEFKSCIINVKRGRSATDEDLIDG